MSSIKIKRSFKVILLFILTSGMLEGQKIEFNGQAACWGTISASPGEQAGLRFIPQLTFKLPLGKKFKLDGEFSADCYAQFTHLKDSAGYDGAGVSLYRSWIRFSGDRIEVRAGLQKINFGSASMLRPLMWFDRIDPRDPLMLTKGVYGIQGKYFFRNNASAWLWMLYGNKSTKGWETVPSKWQRPEFGGRIQVPVPKGEMAFTYHNREASFPDNWQPPVTGNRSFNEQRFACDVKIDLGVGLWGETSISHLDQSQLPPFTRAITFGADYTLGILNGLKMTAEQMFYSSSSRIFSKGGDMSFSGISVSAPLSVITRVSTIFFYDWKNNGLYKFANLSFTFDNLALNVIGFWNPENFSLMNFGTGPNLFAGWGGQIMLVYNF